jgi:hypothetical protein
VEGSTVVITTTSLAESAVAACIYVSRAVTRPREAISHDQAEPPSTTSQGVWATIQLLARLDATGLAQWEVFELLLQFGCMIDQGVPLGVAEKKTLVRATTQPTASQSSIANVAADATARGQKP